MATVLELDKPIAPTTGYKIEKGIPLSDLPQRKGKARYPFAEMEVGDSFFVPNVESNKLGNYCSYQRLKYGTKFSVRKVDGGCRVWRIR